ncbi:TonB-dependent receptor [Sphingoaurantiacus capsulatus]|uniref:TonB-dependent receptor n=1 Tax=Sphingoaurantiacus capsulatus TaxID=1771310 RepID=A0ABV7XB78_9SPHN
MRLRTLLLASVIMLPLPAFAAEGQQVDDLHEDAPEIIVTAPFSRDRQDLLTGTSVLRGEQLASDIRMQIGDTLDDLPGVSATSFGPGASRPVLRGFQGERVRVLTDGIGSIDVSNTSADHAVAIDPITAERVEVLRGPQSLLFGSSAIGGVVNIIDRRIPRRLPTDHPHVDAIASYGSAADERSIAGGFDVAAGGPIVLHADAGYRKSGDLDIGGYLLAPELREHALEHAAEGEEHAAELAAARGTLPNSAVRTTTGGVGASVITDRGTLGFSVGIYDSLYGIPDRPDLHAHEEEEGEEGHDHGAVRIDMRQVRYDMRGELNFDSSLIETVRLRLGAADYKHTELEGDEVGTRFFNEGVEGRLELVQRERDGWKGAVGGQFFLRDLRAIGAEAFVPANETEQYGLFALQTLELGALTLEGAARYEHQSVSSNEAGISRSFNALSGAAGAAFKLSDDWRLGVNLSRTVRAPSAEELLSNGAHIATQSFEIGDPTLRQEKSWGLEGFVRADGENYSLGASVFATRFDNYIYEADAGIEIDELPVFEYRQDDARYFGVELEGSVTVARFGDTRIVADAVADYIRATVKDVGPAPRIPPRRVLVGLEAQSTYIDSRIETEWVDDQNRVADFETPTDGHQVLNASVSWRPFGRERSIALMLSANNILDADVRRHASFLKDFAPLAGRDLRATLKASF